MTTSASPSFDVIFVIGTLDVGGAERHLSYVLPALKKRGLKVALFVMNGDGPLRSVFENGGVPIFFGRQPIRWIERAIAWIIAHFPPKTKTPTVFVLRLIQFGWDVRRLPTLLLKNRRAVLHCFLPGAVIFGGFAGLIVRHPVRVSSRRSLNYYQQARRFWGWLDRHMTATSWLILGNSRAVVDNLIAEGQPAAKVHLLYNGIPEMLSEERVLKRWQPHSHPLQLTIVANLIPYKGHLDLLKAFALIKNQMPSQWRVIFAGYSSNLLYRRELDALCIQQGLTQHVQFVGSCKDVGELYEQTDIGLLVSHEEGFSNSILEAMACGVPMIVTDVGGNSEAVEDGRTGVVVPARNAEALSRAILKLVLSSQADRNALGKAAYQRFKSEFSLEGCVDRYFALYDELLRDQSSHLKPLKVTPER